ncbi:hypothetical protein DSB74_27105, partial [Salmonella enterica subsp. enterica serovar Typhimurium]
IRKVSHILLYAPSFPSFAALPQRKIFRSRKSGISAENLLLTAMRSLDVFRTLPRIRHFRKP